MSCRSRAHTEIGRLSRRITTQLRLAHAEGGLTSGQLDDLRSSLCGLNAFPRRHFSQKDLHFSQKEENYFSPVP